MVAGGPNEVREGKLIDLVGNPDFDRKIGNLPLRNFQAFELSFLDFDFQQANFELMREILMVRGNVRVYTSHSLKIVNINYIKPSSISLLLKNTKNSHFYQFNPVFPYKTQSYSLFLINPYQSVFWRLPIFFIKPLKSLRHSFSPLLKPPSSCKPQLSYQMLTRIRLLIFELLEIYIYNSIKIDT